VVNFKKYFWVALNNSLSTNLWAAVHLLRHKVPIEYYLGSGFSFFPDLVTILVTLRCNLKCAGCSSESPQKTLEFKTRGLNELTAEEIKKFIGQISSFKPAIYFNGGEPTLRKDLFELMNYAKKKGLVTVLTTNGSFLTPEAIHQILDSRLDFFSISLDGPAEYHDEKRGVPGTFLKATTGLKTLIKEREKRKQKFPRIRIASIVNPERLENSKYILDFANDLGVDELAFGYLMFYTKEAKRKQREFMDKYATGGEEMIGLEIDDRYCFTYDRKKLESFLELVKRSHVPVVFVPPGVNPEMFFDTSLWPAKKSRCFSPWFSLTIMPNGDVSPCRGYVVGNIEKEHFLKIWNNEKMRTFRKMRKKTPFPACFRCGEGQDIKFK